MKTLKYLSVGFVVAVASMCAIVGFVYLVDRLPRWGQLLCIVPVLLVMTLVLIVSLYHLGKLVITGED